MKKFGFYFGLISVVFSCHIKNKTSNKNLNSNFLLQGFQSCELVRTNIKTDKCHFLIRINNEKELLDPINLGNFKYQELSKVWIRYTNLRMPNRCENSRPIKIVEIKKREEQ